ncbi:replication initiator protein [Microviridae sp.]|nr:replication initiator protein [Microviridae sp.]
MDYIMTCYRTQTAYYNINENDTIITFNRKKKHPLKDELKLPCGQCIGCRIDHSRSWAIRAIHEAKQYKENTFITLTFNNESLYQRKNPYSLDKKEIQNFIKRLRQSINYKKISYIATGEYGERLGRPHYHLIIFNHQFNNLKKIQTRSREQLYTSDELEKLWKYGFHSIGKVTYQSAAYVARYNLKKISGKNKSEKYTRLDDNNTIIQIEPEFILTSKAPAIGLNHFKKYYEQIYRNDLIVYQTENGIRKTKPPRYYDKKLEQIDPELYETIKQNRKIKSQEIENENLTKRATEIEHKNRMQENVKKLQLKQCKRDVELQEISTNEQLNKSKNKLEHDKILIDKYFQNQKNLEYKNDIIQLFNELKNSKLQLKTKSQKNSYQYLINDLEHIKETIRNEKKFIHNIRHESENI